MIERCDHRVPRVAYKRAADGCAARIFSTHGTGIRPREAGGKTKRKARDACLLSCFLLVIRNAKRNTCSAAAGFHEPPSNGPERSDLNLLCPLHTDSRKGRAACDSRRPRRAHKCTQAAEAASRAVRSRRCLIAKLSCCFGRRGVRGSAELSALVLWKAGDDPVEYEAVDGGEEHGRVGAET